MKKNKAIVQSQIERYQTIAQSPSSKKDATERVREIKKFLDSETGVKWKTRVWENLGWHCSLCCGTLSVYPHYHLHSVSYGVMNSAKGNRGGHIELYHPTAHTPERLIKFIRLSLLQQKAFVKKYIDGYNQNKKMKQFSALKL